MELSEATLSKVKNIMNLKMLMDHDVMNCEKLVELSRTTTPHFNMYSIVSHII